MKGLYLVFYSCLHCSRNSCLTKGFELLTMALSIKATHQKFRHVPPLGAELLLNCSRPPPNHCLWNNFKIQTPDLYFAKYTLDNSPLQRDCSGVSTTSGMYRLRVTHRTNVGDQKFRQDIDSCLYLCWKINSDSLRW